MKNDLCEMCGRPASVVFRKRHKKDVVLCKRCYRDFLAVRSLYHKAYSRLFQFRRTAPDKMLHGLQRLWEKYKHRDHDGWLARSVLADQGMILESLGRYAEALARFTHRRQIGFRDASDFMVNQSFIARTLLEMGRTRSALSELDKGLRKASGYAMYDALNLFALYAEIAENHNLTVPRHLRPLFKATLEWWGIEIDPRLLRAKSSLNRAIQAANMIYRRAASRHQEFLIRRVEPMRKSDPDGRKTVKLLGAYIRREPVGLYRRLAREYVDWIKGATPGSELPGSSSGKN